MEDTDYRIHLKVLTPMRSVYDQRVDMVIARTTDGDLGILYGHEPCLALLGDGILRIIPDKKEKEQDLLMVLGGILFVQNNCAVILSDMAEHPDKLQDYIEQLTKEKEDNLRREKAADLQVHRLERAIRQALVHVDIHPFSSIRKPGDSNQR